MTPPVKVLADPVRVNVPELIFVSPKDVLLARMLPEIVIALACVSITGLVPEPDKLNPRTPVMTDAPACKVVLSDTVNVPPLPKLLLFVMFSVPAVRFVPPL